MPADLHRTNINLHAADVAWLRRRYGYGWTEVVREWVASRVGFERREAAGRQLNSEPRR